MKVLLVAVLSMVVLALAGKQGDQKDRSKNDYMTREEIEDMQLQLAAEKRSQLNVIRVMTAKSISYSDNNQDYSSDKAQCLIERYRDAEREFFPAMKLTWDKLEKELKSGRPIEKKAFLSEVEYVRGLLEEYTLIWGITVEAANEICGRARKEKRQ
ncbi:Hypothetical protein NTJ_11661 [Nesidiocoris tenuis]|uniref:Uncharacterized protein n=1 Tax=Nesidiocoris tenuis TaxID=355587 RepID=A0ABN7B360_9HEMI|nr:Hypothetical protein NTJ_11661 [Nesidiocoris tenuis]